jgi:hypothetical protein
MRVGSGVPKSPQVFELKGGGVGILHLPDQYRSSRK